jgi:hypothetical protein
MSTRCALIVTERNLWRDERPVEEVFRLYRHCDGYPEGMGRGLREICEGIVSGNAPVGWSQQLVSGLASRCSFEIEPKSAVHGDLEYLYRIDVDGGKITVGCWSIGWDEDYERVFEREPLFSETFGGES